MITVFDSLKNIGYDGSNYKKNLSFLFILGELFVFASIFLLFINTFCRKYLWRCRKVRRVRLNLMHTLMWPGIFRYFTEIYLEMAVAC